MMHWAPMNKYDCSEVHNMAPNVLFKDGGPVQKKWQESQKSKFGNCVKKQKGKNICLSGQNVAQEFF